jgi:energy-coupling factor transporter ATP-binding protein EcfA2
MTFASGDVLPYLRGQFARSQPVLFTGAGFSFDVTNVRGMPVPSGRDLAALVWSLCYPGEPADEGLELQYAFDMALQLNPRGLGDLLVQQLSIDADSVPEYYRRYFAAPWHRCYTLNADDIEAAVARRYALPRKIVPVSAMSPSPERPAVGAVVSELEVVHLNGRASDGPSTLTFSKTQYAQRLAMSDLWYERLVADLLSHPFIFVGTSLDETPLWQHIEMRELKGRRGLREMRRRSYLVVPSLDRARQQLLQAYNVHWLPMSAERFAADVLAELDPAFEEGHAFISQQSRGRSKTHTVPDVSDLLSARSAQRNEFLLGSEPTWADIQEGRSAARGIDSDILEIAKTRRAMDCPGLIAITGTAGSGKSTALMTLALFLSSEGARVGWVDRDSDLSCRDVRASLNAAHPPQVIAIDDADLFGSELSPCIHELVSATPSPLVIVATRSSKIERMLNPAALLDVPRQEITMPGLEDRDIDALLDVLERQNRLGILRGQSRNEQRRAFREHARRQLLVAMYEATTGERFAEKAVAEFSDLAPAPRLLYAIVAVASALRYSLGRDEVLIASREGSNTTLNLLEDLIKRGIILPAEDGRRVMARHRVIAELVFDELKRVGQLDEVLSGLVLVAATRVTPCNSRSSREWKFLKQILNKDFLRSTLGVERARSLYAEIEEILKWDYHYWLQRGSLEVLCDRLSTAENFLGQARGLNSDDALVRTEWHYLQFRKAIKAPDSIHAAVLADEARKGLVDLIRSRGPYDSYPYHVLGSQALSWSRRGIPLLEDRIGYLREIVDVLAEGVRRHPSNTDLARLLDDIKRERLLLVTTDGAPPLQMISTEDQSETQGAKPTR